MSTAPRASRELSRVTTVFLIALPGCGGGADTTTRTAEWSGMVRDSAGIRVVSNPETGLWTDQTRWTAVPDLRIGELDGAAEYEFARVTDLDIGAGGIIYVLDGRVARVSAYDAGGRYTHSFGRRGRGPGEFSIGAFAVRVDPQANVLVRDGINRRDNVFGTDGTFLHSIPLGGPWQEWTILPNGEHVVRSSSASWDGIVRLDSEREVTDTVMAFVYDIAKSRGAADFGVAPRSDGRVEIRLLPSLPSWDVSSEGRVITGISDRYRIDVWRLDGTLEMIVEKAHPPLALSARGRAEMMARIEELMGEAGMSEDQIAGSLQRFAFVPPDSLPAFTGVLGGPNGTIWVQRVLPIGAMTANDVITALNAGSPIWDVFCGDGRYLGPLTLPAGFELKSIQGSHVYGVGTDELDVPRVVRLRVGPAMAGSEARLSCL